MKRLQTDCAHYEVIVSLRCRQPPVPWALSSSLPWELLAPHPHTPNPSRLIGCDFIDIFENIPIRFINFCPIIVGAPASKGEYSVSFQHQLQASIYPARPNQYPCFIF